MQVGRYAKQNLANTDNRPLLIQRITDVLRWLVTTSVQLLPVNRPIVVHRHAMILLPRNKPCCGPVTAADILLNIITKYRSYPVQATRERRGRRIVKRFG